MSNFHQVDNHFYRGAQPSDDGFRSLARLGVKTVVDLRLTDARSLHEQQVVTSLGMHYVAIPMHGLGRPTDEELKQTFALLQDSQAWPVFVHCRRGADRTGTIAACYRISHDGWENRRALAEARSYGMAWFEKAMQNFILHFEENGIHALALPAVSQASSAAIPGTAVTP